MPRRRQPHFGCALVGVSILLTVTGCGLELPGAAPAGQNFVFTSADGAVSGLEAPEAVGFGQTCEAVGPARTNDHLAVFDLLNAYRESLGLNSLIYSQTLEAAADDMALDIVVRDFFDHTDPDGNGPPERALQMGFCHEFVGENLAIGFLDAESVIEAWKESPGHHANLVREDYVYVGIGVVRRADVGAVWVQEFALDPDMVRVATASAPAR